MSSILEILEKKSAPNRKKGVQIIVPGEGQIAVTATVIDRRDSGYDRTALLRKLANRGIAVTSLGDRPGRPKSQPRGPAQPEPPAETATSAASPAAVRAPTRAPEVSGEAAGVVRRPIKIKKLSKRVKLGKKIQKGTITLARKPVAVTTGKTSAKQRRTILDAPESMIKIGRTTIGARLHPTPPPIKIRASSYYRNNREIFVNFINGLFEPYKDALLKETDNISCDKKAGKFTLLTHQEIVRDYMSLYTPYRGLLLYHGLGAGKTCASIAIAESIKTSASIALAEGLKTTGEVVIMTPASLRTNYIKELKICGAPLYRLNQFWEFIKTDGKPGLERALASTLNIGSRAVAEQGGAWFVNAKKASNYDKLSANEKISLNAQIDLMISAKYQFINYNGLRASHLDALTKGGTVSNPFDNKVVVIDEAHNFVSRIVNKLGRDGSLSLKLYEFLLDANDCRIVFLTGTPIINYPNELAVLFNMLRGYIKTYVFYLDVQTTRRINQQTIENMFKSTNTYDYIEYNVSAKSLTVTRNPFGFISKRQRNLYDGVVWKGVPSVRQDQYGSEGFVRLVKGILQKNDVKVVKVEEKKFKALPDTLEGFRALFIDSATGDIKNNNLLKRRILGLTSYFRSAQESLLPRFDIHKDLAVELIPMSDYQFGIYEAARAEERDREKKNARRRGGQASGAGPAGAAGQAGAAPNQGGDGNYETSISNYRIFSRSFCNFVFPRAIGRPLPQEGADIGKILDAPGADEDTLDVISLDEKIANVDGRYELDDRAALEKLNAATTDTSYERRIEQAIEALRAKASEYLSPRGLKVYSPKFLEMLNNIEDKDNRGLHLVYSQFRTLEGIGIFKMVLEQNGYAQFKISKGAGGAWKIVKDSKDEGKPMFALYTGTEEAEEKEIIRNIFNGTWDNVPTNIAKELRGSAASNRYGEVIKVFMITSSGAEGITLRNVRFVHIMEPYWHPVRIEQVIGRARRICSHQDLPVEDRTVNVFMYLMKFTNEQLVPEVAKGGMASEDLLSKDVSKLDKRTPFTSDQALYEISQIKENVNRQLLRAVKESAMDCGIHVRDGDKEDLICLSFGSVNPNTFTTTPALTVEREFDVQQERNLEKITWSAIGITIRKRRYAFRPDYEKARTGKIYDYDSYLRARNVGGDPILRGYLKKDEKTGKIKTVGI